MNASDATATALEPLRCPSCGGDHTLSTWVSNDEVERDQLQVRRRCVECGQGYVAAYRCIAVERTVVVR
jgi:transcriptional regulator NrdR family protein